MKATTNIEHDGKFIAAGESVKGIEGDALKALQASGAVVEDKEYRKPGEEDSTQEIARLQNRLVELGIDQSVSPSAPTPGEAAEELAKRDAELKQREDAVIKREKEADEKAKQNAQNTK